MHPSEPGPVRKLIRFASAVARYVASGCQDVTPEQYAERLQLCEQCPLQRHGKCLLCGCPVDSSSGRVIDKARMATEKCPRDPPLWPDLADTHQQE